MTLIKKIIFLFCLVLLIGCGERAPFQGITIHINLEKNTNIEALYKQEKEYCESFKQYLCNPFWGQPKHGEGGVLFEIDRGEYSRFSGFRIGRNGYFIKAAKKNPSNPTDVTFSIFSWGGTDSLRAVIEILERNARNNKIIYSISISKQPRENFKEIDKESLVLKLKKVLKQQEEWEAKNKL